jgi:hypothetical protein
MKHVNGLLALHAALLASSVPDAWGPDAPHDTWGDFEYYGQVDWLSEVRTAWYRKDAMTSFLSAMADATWGVQPDGSFVTDQSADWSGGRSKSLHAPGKQGELARVTRGSIRALRTREDARKGADALRVKTRAAKQEYETRRTQAGARLAAGEPLHFSAGQEGGRFVLDGPRDVSARGAFRAAGLSRADAESAAYAACAAVERKASRGDYSPTYVGLPDAGPDAADIHPRAPRRAAKESLRALCA